MSKKIKETPLKKEPLLFIGDKGQATARASDKGKFKVILTTPALLCADEPLKPLAGFQPQAPRQTTHRLPWDKSSEKLLHVSLDREVLAVLAKVRQKVVFALDVMLKYGQKQKGEEVVLLGVFESSGGVSAQRMLFKKGKFQDMEEFSLPSTEDADFEADLHILCERMSSKHPQADFHWISPLPAPEVLKFVEPGSGIWSLVPAQSLDLSGKPSLINRFGLAAFITGATTAAAVAGTYLPYQKYMAAQSALASESANLQGQFTFASDKLSLLRTRQAFFEEANRSASRLVNFNAVLAVLAEEPDLMLQESKLYAPLDPSVAGLPEGTLRPDFELMVRVEKNENSTALAQSSALLENLSRKMGLGLRLSTVAPYKDVEAGDSKKTILREYRIQGNFNAS